MNLAAAEKFDILRTLRNQSSGHAGAAVHIDRGVGGNSERVARKLVIARGEVDQILRFPGLLQSLGRRAVGVERVGEEVEIVEDIAVHLNREVGRSLERKSQASVADFSEETVDFGDAPCGLSCAGLSCHGVEV